MAHEMINMRMTANKMEEYEDNMHGPLPEYPYGLCIDLDDESLAKLGLTALPKVGSEMMLHAKCVVKTTGATTMQGGDVDCRMSLQITDLAIGETENGQANEDRASKLYGNTAGDGSPSTGTNGMMA